MEKRKGHSIFAHSHFAPRNLPSLFQDTHCLSIWEVKPLKHNVLSSCREIHEERGLGAYLSGFVLLDL